MSSGDILNNLKIYQEKETRNITGRNSNSFQVKRLSIMSPTFVLTMMESV